MRCFVYVISMLSLISCTFNQEEADSKTGVYRLYVHFVNVDGIEEGADVISEGEVIGKLTELHINNESRKIIATLEIKNEFKIPRGSIFMIFSSNMYGKRAINIEKSPSKNYFTEKDVIHGIRQQSLGERVDLNLKPVKSYLEDSLSYKVMENNDSVIVIKFRKNEIYKKRLEMLASLDTFFMILNKVLNKSEMK